MYDLVPKPDVAEALSPALYYQFTIKTQNDYVEGWEKRETGLERKMRCNWGAGQNPTEMISFMFLIL